jgi:hypothetical protein
MKVTVFWDVMPSNLQKYAILLVEPLASISIFYNENGGSRLPQNVNFYQISLQHLQDCINVKYSRVLFCDGLFYDDSIL